MIDALLTDGLSNVRGFEPDAALGVAEEWLEAPEIPQIKQGLQALLPMIDSSCTDILPLLFRLIHPYILNTPPELRHHVLNLIKSLAACSPNETSYYLRKTLDHPDSSTTAWLIRQSVDAFPPEFQPGLRDAVRGR